MVHADVMVKKFFCSWWVLDWGWRDWVFLLFCLKWISTNKEIIMYREEMKRMKVSVNNGQLRLEPPPRVAQASHQAQEFLSSG